MAESPTAREAIARALHDALTADSKEPLPFSEMHPEAYLGEVLAVEAAIGSLTPKQLAVLLRDAGYDVRDRWTTRTQFPQETYLSRQWGVMDTPVLVVAAKEPA